jgi:hypothetical protein
LDCCPSATATKLDKSSIDITKKNLNVTENEKKIQNRRIINVIKKNTQNENFFYDDNIKKLTVKKR